MAVGRVVGRFGSPVVSEAAQRTHRATGTTNRIGLFRIFAAVRMSTGMKYVCVYTYFRVVAHVLFGSPGELAKRRQRYRERERASERKIELRRAAPRRLRLVFVCLGGFGGGGEEGRGGRFSVVERGCFRRVPEHGVEVFDVDLEAEGAFVLGVWVVSRGSLE